LDGDPRIGQPVCWGCSQEFLFSGIVTLSNSVGDSQRVAICRLREICMVEVYTRNEHGKHVACWSDFPLYGGHRFESLRLLNMNKRLSCGCHQVAN
jgi:hypothetical protein